MNNLKTVLQDFEGKDIKEASYEMQFQRKLLHAISKILLPTRNLEITFKSPLQISLSWSKPPSTLKTKNYYCKTSLLQELLAVSFCPEPFYFDQIVKLSSIFEEIHKKT